MRLKLKIGVLSLALLLFSLILYSCVDEPYIEPVKRPFSEVKVINLSHNVDNIRVLIDNAQPVAGLNQITLPTTDSARSQTEFFDVFSGEREFIVYNAAGDSIYGKKLTIPSYERVQVIFAGEYNTDPLISTFSEIIIQEGYVYVEHKPTVQGTSELTFVNAVAPSLDLDNKPFTSISAVAPAPDGTTRNVVYVGTGNPLSYGPNVLIADSVYAGTYNFTFVTESDPNTTYSTEFSSDKRAYIYLYGRPDDVKVLANQIDPPPARPRN